MSAGFSKDYARPTLDKTRLGKIIGLITTIGLGDERNRRQDNVLSHGNYSLYEPQELLPENKD